MVLDVLANRRGVGFKKSPGQFEFATFPLEKKEVVLIKPLTFMNLSGLAVKEALSIYQLENLSHLLVVCDDINLPFGTLRVRATGSDGGHKGLRSITQSLNTQDFPRLRIGIGDEFEDAVDYVLSKFSKSELQELPFLLEQAADAVESFILEGISRTMSRFNRKVLEN
ncbi:MAG: aminoacyl-tRNA hydrolase [Calditrichia bacterium]